MTCVKGELDETPGTSDGTAARPKRVNTVVEWGRVRIRWASAEAQ